MTGKVVTFYSPRGEVGRGMALANVAWLLAEDRQRVLAVDWELDSPILHQIFGRFLDLESLRTRPGVAELIRDFAVAATDRSASTQRRLMPVHIQRVLGAITPVGAEFRDPGRIDFLSARRVDGSAVGGGGSSGGAAPMPDWPRFFGEQPGIGFINGLRDEMADKYDFVLVNCRNGNADGTRAGLVVPPDIVLVCFNMTPSSITLAAEAAQRINEHIDNDRHLRRRHVRIVPVPVRVETSDLRRLREDRKSVGQAFKTMTKLADRQADGYRSEAEIPNYGTEIADTILAVHDGLTPQQETVRAAFEGVAGVIRGNAQSDPGRSSSEETGGGTMAPPDVLISYASVERLWAEWIASLLESPTLRVRLQAIDFGVDPDSIGNAIASAKRVLVLHSASYMRADLAADALTLADRGARLVIAQLDSETSKRSAPVIRLESVTDPSRAVSLIHEGLGLPVAVAGSPASIRWTPRFPGSTAMAKVRQYDARNKDFTGRGAILNEMRERLTRETRDSAALVLAGAAGVGKTSLALEYIHRFAPDYDIIWWVPSETQALAHAALFDLAGTLDITEGDSSAVGRLMKKLRRADATERWLLVYDSADVPNDIEGLIPQGHGHVLITSAETAWPETEAVLPVDVFERDETTTYLRRRLPQSSKDDALKLAESLGDLPLSLYQATVLLSVAAGVSVDDYLERIAQHSGGTLGNEAKAAAAWQVALAEVRKQMPAAAKLFEILVFLAPEPVSKDVYLGQFLVSELKTLNARLDDPYEARKMLQLIIRFGLAHEDARDMNIKILRLVQVVMRGVQSETEKTENQNLAFRALAMANPGDSELPGNWPRYHALWPQFAAPGLLDSELPEVRRLVDDLIRYRYKLGDYAGSEELARQTIDRWSEVSSPDNLFILKVRSHRGSALRRLGQFDAARLLDEDTCDMLRNTVGPNDLNTLIAESGLASDLRAIGEYKDALTLDEHTVQQAGLLVGEDDDRALNFANNLATSYRMVGEPAKAEKLDRQTYERRKIRLGEDHPYTYSSANSLGRDLRDLGRFEESETWLRLAYAGYVRLHGKDHPDTFWAAKNLAVTLRRLAQFKEAHELSNDTYIRSSKKLGPNHPESLVCLMTVATTYSGMEKHDPARQAGEDAVREMTSHEELGAEHVYTLLARHNLAAIELKARQKLIRVQEMEIVKDALRDKLGEDHWIFAMTSMNLANHLYESGDPSSARFVDEKAHQLLCGFFGETHPDAVSAAINLAIGYKASGSDDKAETLMQQAMRWAADAGLPPDHPRVVCAKNWVRWTYTYIDPPPLA